MEPLLGRFPACAMWVANGHSTSGHPLPAARSRNPDSEAAADLLLTFAENSEAAASLLKPFTTARLPFPEEGPKLEQVRWCEATSELFVSSNDLNTVYQLDLSQ